MAIENENQYRQELIRKYREKFDSLFRYIPWFEQKQGGKTSYIYQGDDKPMGSVPIPVYDSTLLGFVKEMQATGMMDRNYVYVLSRNNIRNVSDEHARIESAELKNIEDITGIMAKYVLGGMTKGWMWSQAVENGIFLHALTKMKELLDVWDQPLA